MPGFVTPVFAVPSLEESQMTDYYQKPEQLIELQHAFRIWHSDNPLDPPAADYIRALERVVFTQMGSYSDSLDKLEKDGPLLNRGRGATEDWKDRQERS
jgi:hypothetical protein